MRNIYKSFVLGVALVTLSSCGNNWLDLDPNSEIPTEKAIVDYKSADVALTGIYNGLQGTSSKTTYYGTSMWLYGDVRGEDMQSSALSSRGSGFYSMKYTANDAPSMWGVPYNVILRVNRLIEAIDSNKIGDATPAQLDAMKSQALAIRALVHFDLCRIYGAPYNVDNGASYGIPIVLETLPVASQETRNTVAEVYEQVIKDIEKSLEVGGLTKEKNYGYVNYWFVKGLLAKVYLYKGDNDKALETSEEVIQSSPYELWTNEEYVDGWKTTDKGRKEMLFEIVNFSAESWTDREGIANIMSPYGYADAVATKAFIDMLATTPDDVRNKILIESVKAGSIKLFGKSKVFVNKYPRNEAGEWRLNSLPAMRLSEVYLFAAEAAAKLGDSQKAARYLNAIHKRANPKAADITAAEATLERVILERRKELIGEGSRFFDAMRNNETITRYTNEENRGFHPSLDDVSRSFNRTYFRTLLPIPLSETNVNAPIRAQQNPGYGK